MASLARLPYLYEHIMYMILDNGTWPAHSRRPWLLQEVHEAYFVACCVYSQEKVRNKTRRKSSCIAKSPRGRWRSEFFDTLVGSSQSYKVPYYLPYLSCTYWTSIFLMIHDRHSCSTCTSVVNLDWFRCKSLSSYLISPVWLRIRKGITTIQFTFAYHFYTTLRFRGRYVLQVGTYGNNIMASQTSFCSSICPSGHIYHISRTCNQSLDTEKVRFTIDIFPSSFVLTVILQCSLRQQDPHRIRT